MASRFEALPAGVQEHVVAAADLASKRALRASSRSMLRLVTPFLKFESAEVMALAGKVVHSAETYALRALEMRWVYPVEFTYVSEAPETEETFLAEHGTRDGMYDIPAISRLATAQLRWALAQPGVMAACEATYEGGLTVRVEAVPNCFGDAFYVEALMSAKRLASVRVKGTLAAYGGPPPTMFRVLGDSEVFIVAVIAAYARLAPFPAPPTDVHFVTDMTLEEFDGTPMHAFVRDAFRGWGLRSRNPQLYVESVVE